MLSSFQIAQSDPGTACGTENLVGTILGTEKHCDNRGMAEATPTGMFAKKSGPGNTGLSAPPMAAGNIN